jgi:hypothetical protein
MKSTSDEIKQLKKALAAAKRANKRTLDRFGQIESIENIIQRLQGQQTQPQSK